MLVRIVLFALGLVGLGVGARWLVAGAARLAHALGISVLAVGLTIVAFGTSAPELVVSLMASAVGRTDVAVGNAVGSNIANIALILGLTAVLTPIPLGRDLVRRDIPLMILASLVLFAFASDGVLGRLEGGSLLMGLGGYVAWTLGAAWSRSDGVRPPPRTDHFVSEERGARPRRRADVARVVAGLVVLAIAARMLVATSIYFARALGISELVIGLTVVALGTSLPELATSLSAAARHQADIAGGNLIGSNIFNILCILGLAAVVRPLHVGEHVLHIDLPVMVGAGLVLFPLALLRRRLGRLEGALLLAGYVAYIALTLMRDGVPPL